MDDTTAHLSDEILTVREAAALLKTSTKALLDAVHRRGLRVARFGKAGKVWRFRRQDLIDYFRSEGGPTHGIAERHGRVRAVRHRTRVDRERPLGLV